MFQSNFAYYGFYITCAIAVGVLVDIVFLSFSRRMNHNRCINKRLSVLATTNNRHEALIELRRKRGLSADGKYVSPMIWFNQLVLQSGITVPISRLVLSCVALSIVPFGLVYGLQSSWMLAMLAALITGILFPLMFLRLLRRRRLTKFEAQLPDAIDIMVRSLRAGHPIPVAISMVSREMPDPIGTEFGITADEVTFGLDLEEAMRNELSRVGQLDLALVVVAISLQSKTGGNLSEILGILSGVIRQRFKLKRKVRALSSEGRFSAIALGAIPALLATFMFLFAPSYYGDVWNNPVITYGLYFAAMLMVIGYIVMHRMVNFRF